MCGLSGVLVNADLGTYDQQNAVKTLASHLLFVNSMRGMDATGVYATSTNDTDQETFRRETVPAAIFPIKHVLDHKMWLNLIMTHNRSSTMGDAHNVQGAHPHRVGDTILTHNGTVRAHGIPVDYRKYLSVSDSFAITNLINDKGIEYAIKELSGSYTMVYFNKTDPSLLKFITNRERPLSIAKIIKDKKVYGIAWSSEADTLEYVSNRLGFTLRDQFTPEAHELTIYNQNNGKFSKRVLEAKPKAVVHSYTSSTWTCDKERFKELGINETFPMIFQVDSISFGSCVGTPVHPLEKHDIRIKSWRLGAQDVEVGDYVIAIPQYVNNTTASEKWRWTVTCSQAVNLTRRGYAVNPKDIPQLRTIRKAFKKNKLHGEPKPPNNAKRETTTIPLPHSGSTVPLLAYKEKDQKTSNVIEMYTEEGPQSPLCLYCYTPIFCDTEPYARITQPMELTGAIHNDCLDEIITQAEHFAHQIDYVVCDDRKSK